MAIDLTLMTKPELIEYAQETLGLTLDARKSRHTLINDVVLAIDSPAPVKKGGEVQKKGDAKEDVVIDENGRGSVEVVNNIPVASSSFDEIKGEIADLAKNVGSFKFDEHGVFLRLGSSNTAPEIYVNCSRWREDKQVLASIRRFFGVR